MSAGNPAPRDDAGEEHQALLRRGDDARTDRVMWVKGDKKKAGCSSGCLEKLLKEYVDGRSSTWCWKLRDPTPAARPGCGWREFGQKFRLHFLPPYCPDDNRIERKGLAGNARQRNTVNHECARVTNYAGKYLVAIRYKSFPSSIRSSECGRHIYHRLSPHSPGSGTFVRIYLNSTQLVGAAAAARG